MSLNEQQNKDVIVLSSKLDQIQEFVNLNIIGKNQAIISSDIYKMLGDIVADVDELTFKRSFSINVKLGNIKGIYGARKAGFKPIESQVSDEGSDRLAPPPPLSNSEAKTQVLISKNVRVIALDKRNWAIQKATKNGDQVVWLSQNYWPSLPVALNGISKLLINKEIKASKLFLSDVKEIKDCIKAAEERVCAKLDRIFNEMKLAERNVA